MLFFVGVLRFSASQKKKKTIQRLLMKPFPDHWLELLSTRVVFYQHLSESEKDLFRRRIQLFLATKRIEGIDNEIDDDIRVLVAVSAIIPTFAFPGYNYPNVQTILIYPNSFDETFQTKRYKGHNEFISGMISGRYQSSTVILSKADLNRDFDGIPHSQNVGIHEFVHLLDKEDGIVDGIPEILVQHAFVGPWLIEIKKEIKRIEKRKSCINPYGLKNNAEFLAVVSEYFFSNPYKFKKKHPELYQLLATIFKTK